MDARSIADRSAIGRVVRFSGGRRHSIQFRSGFFVVADDSEDRVAHGEDWVRRENLPVRSGVLIDRESFANPIFCTVQRSGRITGNSADSLLDGSWWLADRRIPGHEGETWDIRLPAHGTNSVAVGICY